MNIKSSQFAFGLTLALLPLHALALDLTPDASRVVSDPAYLPEQGQFYGSSEYSYSKGSYGTDNYLGHQTSAHDSIGNTVNQTLEYGVTDDVALRLSDAYEWNRGHSQTNTGAITDTDSHGFINPTLGATWRVLDQKTFPVSWDLIGAYAPNTFDAKSASRSQDGTVARGGSTVTMGTALSYKTADFTLYGLGSASYLGSRDVENQTNGFSTSYGSNWQYELELNTQTRLTSLWSVNAGVSEIFTTNATASYPNPNGTLTDFTSKPGDSTNLNVALNYQVIPNRLVASVIYTHEFIEDGKTDYSILTHSDSTTKNDNDNVYSAELRYVFN